jgi:hypothetical protein
MVGQFQNRNAYKRVRKYTHKVKKDPIKDFVSTLNNIAGNADTKKFRKIRNEAEKSTNQKTSRWTRIVTFL